MSAVTIYAPFTPEQVEALKKWQEDGRVHPFTCGGCFCVRTDREDEGKLIPSERGWVCPCGAYKQDWAHGFMAGEAARSAAEFAGSLPPVIVTFTPQQWARRQAWLRGLDRGDSVIRMLAGKIPQQLPVTDVTDKIIECGWYTFDRETGKEIDEDIPDTVSYIIPVDRT